MTGITHEGGDSNVDRSPYVWGDREAMLRDHSATTNLFSTLVDVRFKLLTFVPTVTAIAVGIVTVNGTVGSETPTQFVVGVIGFFAAAAVVVYEIRNSQIHDRAIHRLRHLERLLGFPPAQPGLPPQGMFSERGVGDWVLGIARVQHDRALAMIYGVVLAAWSWVLIAGAETAFDLTSADQSAVPWIRVGVPLLVAIATAVEIARLGGKGREPALVFNLVELVVEPLPALEDDFSRFGIARGEEVFSRLKHVQSKAPQESVLALKKEVAQYLKKEVEENLAKRGHSFSDEHAQNLASKFLELAYATRAISDQQRWFFWWWSRWDERKKRTARSLRLRPKYKEVKQWVPAIRGGIVAADEVFRAIDPDGVFDCSAVSQELADRYGRGAPWTSPLEVALRKGVLDGAAKEDMPD